MNALNLFLATVFVLEETSLLSMGIKFLILAGASMVFILFYAVLMLRCSEIREDIAVVGVLVVIVCCLFVGMQYAVCLDYGWDYYSKSYRLISSEDKSRYEDCRNYRVLDLNNLSQEEYAAIFNDIKH